MIYNNTRSDNITHDSEEIKQSKNNNSQAPDKLYIRHLKHIGPIGLALLLSTHSHDPCYWGESDVPACGPPASFSVHLANSAVTPAGSVHKSRGDNVVRMWVQLKR